MLALLPALGGCWKLDPAELPDSVVAFDPAIGGPEGWVVESFDRSTSAWTQVQQRSANEGTTTVVVDASQSAVVFLGTGGVTPTPPAAIQINVTNPSGGECVTSAGSGSIRCLRVTVSAGGQVRMCDPGLATGSAAAC